MKKGIAITGAGILSCLLLQAQPVSFPRQDSLRGGLSPERTWWDLNYYHLEVQVDPADSSLTGTNTICFTALEQGQVLQIDLQPPLRLFEARQNGIPAVIRQEGAAHFVELPGPVEAGASGKIEVTYGGRPHVAKNPPWDGGITWKQDENDLPFIASACQGIGSSIWWPCKDHPYDEPDSILISVTVPEYLMDVSNGKFRGMEENPDNTKTWHWFVSNPINHYAVNINIGDYTHFSEVYQGENGPLNCDYYVLKNNIEAARKQFRQVSMMLEAFEHWFGPYPFYEDGYKLVEAPYLGMEHQSSITYGNKYQNGYLGRDLSNTGWGMKFDFIIIHESGHEWFANNITYADVADMWIHESFINYSESLFLDYHFGTEAGNTYVRGTRANIANDRPIIGEYGVDHRGSGDMYYKGGNMLHTIRRIIGDDETFRQILRGLNREFYHQTVSTKQIEEYMNQRVNVPLEPIFDQYLRDYRLPVFEYYFRDGILNYRFGNCNRSFTMPLEVTVGGREYTLTPTTRWARKETGSQAENLRVHPDYYVSGLNILGEQ